MNDPAAMGITLEPLSSARQKSADGAIGYTVYGFTPILSSQVPSRFTGQPLDGTTGCYVMGQGYRFYHPVLQRFLLPDIYSPFAAGGINAYAYCAGDPVNRHDRSGRSSYLIATQMLDRLSPRRVQPAQATRPLLLEVQMNSTWVPGFSKIRVQVKPSAAMGAGLKILAKLITGSNEPVDLGRALPGLPNSQALVDRKAISVQANNEDWMGLVASSWASHIVGERPGLTMAMDKPTMDFGLTQTRATLTRHQWLKAVLSVRAG